MMASTAQNRLRAEAELSPQQDVSIALTAGIG